jgi:hypothetical protein
MVTSCVGGEERETVAVSCRHSHQPAVCTLDAYWLQPAFLFSVQVFTFVSPTIICHCLSVMSLWYRCNFHSFQGINMVLCFTICTVFNQQRLLCTHNSGSCMCGFDSVKPQWLMSQTTVAKKPSNHWQLAVAWRSQESYLIDSFTPWKISNRGMGVHWIHLA